VPLEESLSCDDPSVLGPRQGEVFSYVAFDVPADGDYTFTGVPIDGGAAWMEIKECQLGCSSIEMELPADGLGRFFFLRAGRYSLRMTRLAERDTTAMSVTISGDDCR
jgi:hypothetical protein